MKTVLIVDDTRVVREIIKVFLIGSQFEVIEAADGIDALARVQQAVPPPDVVVADLRMPRLDGLALCTALKANPRTKAIPVIILTSDPALDQAQRCREAGAFEVLTKPVMPPVLIKAISNALGLPAASASALRGR